MYGINLHLSSKLMINVGKCTIQKEHHGIGIIILTTQGSLWTNQYDSWKFFMAPGEIVAPEAEEVPFSRMVNREMHRAGSCRPCLHLGKGRLWCVLVRERSWELLRWGDLYFFPKVNWGAIWNMQNLPNHRGSWPDFFFVGTPGRKVPSSRWRLQFIWTINLNHPFPNQTGISLDALR